MVKVVSSTDWERLSGNSVLSVIFDKFNTKFGSEDSVLSSIKVLARNCDTGVLDGNLIGEQLIDSALGLIFEEPRNSEIFCNGDSTGKSSMTELFKLPSDKSAKRINKSSTCIAMLRQDTRALLILAKFPLSSSINNI